MQSKSIGDYQQQIDKTIRALGGYWRPLSALARLIEELGEVHELMLHSDQSDANWHKELASELTDLYIISTCLANQYCADLEAVYEQLGHPVNVSTLYHSVEPLHQPLDGLLLLSAQAGQIARILNHYEGDKKKKPSENHKSLAIEIATLHILLLRFALALDIPLFDYIQETLEKNLSRDKNRFAITHDPSTEASRARFIELLASEGKVTTHKIWGAFPWKNDQSVELNVRNSMQTVARWLKCGEAEGIKGVVWEYVAIGPTTVQDLQQIAREMMKVLQDELDADELKVKVYTNQLPLGHEQRMANQESTFYYLTRREG